MLIKRWLKQESILFLLNYFLNLQAREKPNKHPKIFIVKSDIGKNLFRTERQVRLHISVQRNCSHTKTFSLMLSLAMQVQKKKKRILLPQISGRSLQGFFFLVLTQEVTSAHLCFKEGEDPKLCLSISEFWWEWILHSADKPEYRLPGNFFKPYYQCYKERK